MRETVSENHSRTDLTLFYNHNVAVVKRLCYNPALITKDKKKLLVLYSCLVAFFAIFLGVMIPVLLNDKPVIGGSETGLNITDPNQDNNKTNGTEDIKIFFGLRDGDSYILEIGETREVFFVILNGEITGADISNDSDDCVSVSLNPFIITAEKAGFAKITVTATMTNESTQTLTLTATVLEPEAEEEPFELRPVSIGFNMYVFKLFCGEEEIEFSPSAITWETTGGVSVFYIGGTFFINVTNEESWQIKFIYENVCKNQRAVYTMLSDNGDN